jgi:hypothetical protein
MIKDSMLWRSAGIDVAGEVRRQLFPGLVHGVYSKVWYGINWHRDVVVTVFKCLIQWLYMFISAIFANYDYLFKENS